MLKNKLNLPQFFIVLNGPVCAGKSSIAQYFLDNFEDIFRACKDKIKWLISDYTPEKYNAVMSKMMIKAIEIAFMNGLSVIQDQGMYKGFEKEYHRIIDEYGLVFIEANIEASFKVLSKRFTERIEAAKQGAKISLTDPEEMRRRYELFISEKDRNLPTFITDYQTPGDIAEQLVRMIRDKS